MKVTGIIPARGGSKGIPYKNLAPCNGKPLIYWTIKEAKRSSLDALYVSTDCDKIAEYAADQGVAILWRPIHLAGDDSRTIDTLRYHLKIDVRDMAGCDAVFTLQPTNPLRTAATIDNACCLLEDGDGNGRVDSVVGMVNVGERHPFRMYESEGGLVKPLAPGKEFVRRQDLTPCYLRAGEVYVTRTETILAGSMTGSRCSPMFLDKSECWNVDDETDLVIVEALMKARG